MPVCCPPDLSRMTCGMLLCRGGIPILFPQVGVGRLPRGGFMSDLHWSLADSAIAPGYLDGDTEDAAPSIVLHAQDDPWTLTMFPHEFEALYTVCPTPPPPLFSPSHTYTHTHPQLCWFSKISVYQKTQTGDLCLHHQASLLRMFQCNPPTQLLSLDHQKRSSGSNLPGVPCKQVSTQRASLRVPAREPLITAASIASS